MPLAAILGLAAAFLQLVNTLCQKYLPDGHPISQKTKTVADKVTVMAKNVKGGQNGQ